MWMALKARIAAMRPVASTLDMLWEQAQQAWADIPTLQVNHQIERMNERLTAIKAANGKATNF